MKGVTASRKPKAPPFEAGNQAAAGHHDMTGAEKAKHLRNLLFDIAMNTGAADMARIRAAEAFLNREEGLPIARAVTINKDDISSWTDEQLAAEMHKLEEQIRDAEMMKSFGPH